MRCEAVKPNGERTNLRSQKIVVPADRAIEVMNLEYGALDGAILHITCNQTGNELFLKVEKPAYYVPVEADIPGHFSDNAFDLLPGEAKSIFFTPDDANLNPNFVIRDIYSATCK